MRHAVLMLALGLVVAGCALPAPQPSQPGPSNSVVAPAPPRITDARTVARNFIAVVETVEPVAERICRAETRGVDCDFQIVIDDRPGVPPNAFQTVDKQGRPIIGFTIPLIAEARNRDELAFVLGHEAAHHIAGHLDRTAQNATMGAIIFGGLASLGGAGEQTVRSAQQIGASLGQRRYSKEFELEADALGTIITERAGYDAVRGAAFFARIPDPGDQFLGTHPPNAARIETVRQTAARMR